MERTNIRQRILKMVEVGFTEDFISRFYDYISIVLIGINLTATVLLTFNYMEEHYYGILSGIEFVTVVFFAIDYILRIYTADLLYPDLGPVKSLLKYVFSFSGIVDLLSFLPFFLPIFFPAGSVAFKVFRVARVFRIFRVNAYYDSLNVITAVLSSKKQQLFSSLFILVVLMLSSSLCMYGIENPVQPEVFSNAFSGIWWSASTLLTVGYGDIYPITTAGKVFGILITFLGCGMVAIPTGIISAGFVEQYSRFREISEEKSEKAISFIRIAIDNKDPWSGKLIKDLSLPKDVVVACIIRDKEVYIPRGDVLILPGDILVIGAMTYNDDWEMHLDDVIIKKDHDWENSPISELDISRQTVILYVTRNEETIIPDGNFILRAGDEVLLFNKKKIKNIPKVVN